MLKNNLTSRERIWILKEKDDKVKLLIKKNNEVLMEFEMSENFVNYLKDKGVIIVK